MKRVGIADLKAHLSRYLAEVEAGEIIIVCDRKRPVATITREVPTRPRLTVRQPTLPVSALQDLTPARPNKPIDVVELLRELRRDFWE